jgi:hypothetical protein
MPLNQYINSFGSMSLDSIREELGLGTSISLSLNDSRVRNLAENYSNPVTMPFNFLDKSGFNSRYWFRIVGRDGASNIEKAFDIGVNRNLPDEIFVVGTATNTASATNPLTKSILITRIRGNGIAQFTRSWGTGDAYDAVGCAITIAGSFYRPYIVGHFYTPAKFNQGYWAYFNAVTGNGLTNSQREFGSINFSEYLFSNAADSLSSTYSVGAYFTSAANTDIIVIKQNSSGITLWANRLGSGGFSLRKDSAYSIAAEYYSGNVFIVGETTASGASQDFIVAKYDTNANLLWQRQLTNSGSSTEFLGNGNSLNDYSEVPSRSIAVELTANNSNVYVCGSFQGSPYTYPILFKYDNNGVYQWARSLVDTSNSFNEYGFSVAADANNGVYICGYKASTNSAILLAKYNYSGVLQWSRTIDITNNLSPVGDTKDRAYSIKVDAFSNIYLCGETSARNKSFANNSADMFIAKLPGDGSLTGIYDVADCGISYINNLATVVNSSFSLTNSAATLSNTAHSITNATTSLNPDTTLTLSTWTKPVYSNESRYIKLINNTDYINPGTWAQPFGYGTAVDRISGNSYAVISDSTTLYTVKFNSFGDILWKRLLKATDNGSTMFPYGIALSANGDAVYIAGSFYHSSISLYGFDHFHARITSSGVVSYVLRTYTNTTGFTAEEETFNIALDNSSLYATGYGTTSAANPYGDIIVIKVPSATGSSRTYARRLFTSVGDERGYGIATDNVASNAANVYVTGYNTDGLSLIKLDSAGATLWQRNLTLTDGSALEIGWDIAVATGAVATAADNFGSVYVVARGQAQSPISNYCLQLHKYLANGVYVSTYSYEFEDGRVMGTDQSTCIKYDPEDGFLYIATKISGIPGSPDTNALILKVNSINYEIAWAIGVANTTPGYSVAHGKISLDSSPRDCFYFAGTIRGTDIPSTTTFGVPSDFSAFLLKLPKDGSFESGIYGGNGTYNVPGTKASFKFYSISDMYTISSDMTNTATTLTNSTYSVAGTSINLSFMANTAISDINYPFVTPTYSRHGNTNFFITTRNNYLDDSNRNNVVVSMFLNDLTSDYYENIYTAGYAGVADANISSYNRTGGVITKYNKGGDILWQNRSVISDKLFTVDNGDGSFSYLANYVTPTSIVVDKFGNTYVCGTLTCFDQSTGGSFTNIFVSKYDVYGQVLWYKTLAPPSQSGLQARKILLDSSNNIYVGVSQTTNFNQYIIKFDNNGNILAQTGFKSTNSINVFLASMEIDSSNNIYVLIKDSSLTNIQVSKYNSSLAFISTTSYVFGGGGVLDAVAIALDKLNNVYITGNKGPGSSTTAAITIKLNTSLVPVWLREYSTSNSSAVFSSTGISVDNSSNKVIISLQELGPGYSNTKIVSYATDTGVPFWQRTIGSDNNSRAKRINSIKVDNTNNFIFGGNLLNNILLAKLPLTGTIPSSGRYSFAGDSASIIYSSPSSTDSTFSLISTSTNVSQNSLDPLSFTSASTVGTITFSKSYFPIQRTFIN